MRALTLSRVRPGTAAISSIGQAFATPGSGGDASGFFGKFDAPDEIKADVQTLAKWYRAYAAALQKAGFKAGQTPTSQQLQSYQAALAGLDRTGVAEASQRISAWAQAAAGQPPEAPAFTLDRAMQYALDHYPTVRAALERVNASTAGVSVARAAYLPRLDSL